jgi:hypothetical protein
MNAILLAGLVLFTALAVTAQHPQVKPGVKLKNYQRLSRVTVQPASSFHSSITEHKMATVRKNTAANSVTVLTLGTSANTNGYSGGTRTMLWANDDLNCVVNIHRMGPGTVPANLADFLGMDIGLNMGKTPSDWTTQVQVQASNLLSSPNYYDASRFPSAAIYNPAGNTILANAYLAFFNANYANLHYNGLGGYGYGTASLADHADTTRHLRWYNPLPYNFVPDGFTVSKAGMAYMVSLDMNTENGVEVYQDSVIFGRGRWNAVTKDFDYTFRTIAFPCNESKAAADCKIAASPDGTVLWISVLTNFAGGSPGYAPLIDSTFYPLLRRSTDCGLTWEDPIPVILDGPNGIYGIKNQYSDYFIQNYFIGPPFPTRDEIPYTTAFDHSLSVDKWGNPHIGVAVGYAPGGYRIATGADSLVNVYDVFTCDDGMTFHAVCMGSLATFRGRWNADSSDNRVYISSTNAGDKMFVTWNDTRVAGEPDNQHPDVWARGFDLYTNKITSVNGLNEPDNVTSQSSIAQEAYWQCASPYVFTDNSKYTIPICTQWFAEPAPEVTFRYIADFSFTYADFTIPTLGCRKNSDSKMSDSDPVASPAGGFWPCDVGLEPIATEPPAIAIHPNPADDFLNLSLSLERPAVVNVMISNVFGQVVITRDKIVSGGGLQEISIDISRLPAGMYFITVEFDRERLTRKVVVE